MMATNCFTSQPVLEARPTASVARTSSELLTPEQTAALLEVSAGTLSVWRSTKRYPLKYIKIGSKVRYTRESIERFLSLRTQSGVSEPNRRARK